MKLETTGSCEIDRRNWLKAATLSGAATLFAGGNSFAQTSPTPTKVRGVIFMVSDGMSPGVLTLAEGGVTL